MLAKTLMQGRQECRPAVALWLLVTGFFLKFLSFLQYLVDHLTWFAFKWAEWDIRHHDQEADKHIGFPCWVDVDEGHEVDSCNHAQHNHAPPEFP